jgi:hypothetical protein
MEAKEAIHHQSVNLNTNFNPILNITTHPPILYQFYFLDFEFHFTIIIIHQNF